ncbi:MAG: RNA 2',3'-cyclic phosphodiesterase [Thermoplasmata archaeon]|nr:RNA 2',3'-cyclic phosphodiesterase [Thermoplasmata archaeon]MCI4356324.1 RNA 2',3'-cyclic phosphodiesterase [Thermoplasmata archaeon]
MRAFVALDIPAIAERPLGAPAMTHLTLEFLGEISPEVVPSLGEAIAAALGPVAPFRMTIEGVGAFPNESHPRVVWAGVQDGRDALIDLACRVATATASVVARRDTRPFTPHVTILRVRGPRDLERARRVLSEWAGRSFASFEVGEVVLYESDLRPQGAVHTALRRVPLTGSRVTRRSGGEPADGEPPR